MSTRSWVILKEHYFQIFPWSLSAYCTVTAFQLDYRLSSIGNIPSVCPAHWLPESHAKINSLGWRIAGTTSQHPSANGYECWGSGKAPGTALSQSKSPGASFGPCERFVSLSEVRISLVSCRSFTLRSTHASSRIRVMANGHRWRHYSVNKVERNEGVWSSNFQQKENISGHKTTSRSRGNWDKLSASHVILWLNKRDNFSHTCAICVPIES